MSASLPVSAPRGQTYLADKVIAKVAAQAAREATNASEAPSDLAVDAGHRPRAEVRRRNARDGRGAELRVVLDLVFPAPIAALASQVRANVRERVETLCGEAVRYVDVHVDRLRVAGSGGRRVQ